MAEQHTIVELRGITKSFNANKALDNINLSIKEGEILAICGENGAGKSTLMKILSGAYAHGLYEGDILLNNVVQEFRSPADSASAGIAMIYQELSMHLDSSIMENIFLGEWISNKGVVNFRQMKKKTREYLEPVGLQHLDPTLPLRKLSASQQQLVSIARALWKKPRVLLLDEPTSPLTLNESENLFRIIHNLKKSGVTCVLITHRMDEVFKNADRVYVIRDGKTINSHPVAETNYEELVSEMVGRSFKSYYPKETVPLGDEIFRCEGITVPHPFISGKNIVEDVGFTVRAGEIVGIAGLVGAGRSETVNAIYGKIEKTKGDVYVEGKKVNISSPKDSLKCPWP